MKDLRARQEIGELMVRYATAVDRRDFPRLRQCFTVDAMIDYYPIGVFEGVEKLVDFLKIHQANTGPRLTRITNVDVEVDGEDATCHCYVDSVVLDPDGNDGMNPIGFFEDRLQLVGDEWKIAVRKFTMVHLGRVGGVVSGSSADDRE